MNLEWGIKASFVAYVEGAPDGQILCGDGAVRRDGSFWFPVASIDEGGTQATCAGSVVFSAHDQLLHVHLERPHIVTELGQTSLMVSESATTPELRIASLSRDPSSALGTVVYSARLTTLGSQMLGGVYPVGSELAPVRVSLRA